MTTLSGNIWVSYVIIFISISAIETLCGTVTSNPKIVIIGAGPSGIAAATKLLEYGFEDVTILEAEPRIGGRVHTIPFADNVVDLGAQWCQGEENNVVYEIVKDLDMLGSSMENFQNITMHRSNGEQVPEGISKRLMALIEEIDDKRFHDTTTPYIGSAHDFIKEEFFKALERDEYKDIDIAIATECFEFYLKQECSSEGSDDLTDTPVDGDFEYCEGNQALTWKDKGYKSFLNLLMKTDKIGKEYGVLQDRIRLSTKVKNINWQRDDSKVMIKCDDNEEILADHVIVTVSLGVLKEQYKTLFNPKLPDDKQAAINAIGFGTVNKIFMEFDKKFWPDMWTGMLFLWTDKDLKSIRNTENFWWEGMFATFTVDYQPRILEFWLIGPSARHMEKLDINKIKNDCVDLLKRFLKWDIPEPVNVIKTTWLSNSNFKGSWSYHSNKMIGAGISATDLVAPLTVDIKSEDCVKANGSEGYDCKKPVLLFAGEATNAKHYALVNGAVETGWREANRLALYYSKTKEILNY